MRPEILIVVYRALVQLSSQRRESNEEKPQ